MDSNTSSAWLRYDLAEELRKDSTVIHAEDEENTHHAFVEGSLMQRVVNARCMHAAIHVDTHPPTIHGKDKGGTLNAAIHAEDKRDTLHATIDCLLVY